MGKSKLDDVKGFQIVALAVQHVERVEDFIREQIQIGKMLYQIGYFVEKMSGKKVEKYIIVGEPVVEKLLENQDEAYEGSHLEMAINQLASLCIKQNVISGVKPSAIAAVGSKNFYR